MAKRSVGGVIAPAYVHKWTKLEEWNGLVKGDAVKVAGERGDFVFISAHELDGEIIAVNVHGGVYGHKSFRAFYPEKVSKPVVKKSRRRKDDEDPDQ